MDIIIPQKRCTKCLKEKPATKDYFRTDPAHKDGLSSRCKACLSRSNRPSIIKGPAPTGYKWCTACQQAKPATTEFFYPHKRCKDGLNTQCIECIHQEKQRDYRQKHPKPDFKKYRPQSQDAFKRCTQCLKEYPATREYFSPNSRGAFGLQARCKACRKADYRAYEKENKAHVCALQLRYRVKNRTTINERQLIKRSLNREYMNKQARGYHANHRDEYNARNRKRQSTSEFKHGRKIYRFTHREEYLARTHARRTRIKGNGGRFTAQDIQRQFKAQKGKCYWCNKRLSKYEIDHLVPVSRGGTSDPSNLVLACPHCNRSRNNRLPHEWPQGNRLL